MHIPGSKNHTNWNSAKCYSRLWHRNNITSYEDFQFRTVKILTFLGFVYASLSKWNLQYIPFLLNWCSWMTTFSNLKTYLPLALKHLFGCHFKHLWKKQECYCNISVWSINGTTKNTGWPRPFWFENVP